jgi:DNA-directed RNA polymerase specialized sigma24 family protein
VLFGAIFERHFVPIHRYLNRRVGLDLAEDLASETFVVAFRRRAGYDWGREDARPWLFGIATNLMRRYRRTERRKLAAYARIGVNPLVASDSDLDAAEDQMIFDPETAQLLGENDVLVDPAELTVEVGPETYPGTIVHGPGRPGMVLYSVVYLASGVVDSTAVTPRTAR